MPRRPATALLRSLRFRLAVYLLAALILVSPVRRALEHHFLYFPTPGHPATPADAGLTYEEVVFPAADGVRLTGWLVPGEDGSPVVLFCMGNAGSIADRLDTLRLLHELGVAVFIFDYRGYGTSAGRASEAGLYADIAGARALLRSRGWAPARTILFGRSLGAAVALQSALDEPAAGLVMEAAFTSIHAMGRHHYPLLNLLLGWLVAARFDNLEKIAALKSPLLLMHGSEDAICPPEMAEVLASRVSGAKELYRIAGADHNDGFVVGGAGYRQTLREAFARWTGFRAEAP